MTPAELRRAIADLGMTQVGFARAARVNPATVRRWLAGQRRIPGPVVELVRLLLQKRKKPNDRHPQH
jgi:DNA-binding transcriptional regulator YiaG